MDKRIKIYIALFVLLFNCIRIEAHNSAAQTIKDMLVSYPDDFSGIAVIPSEVRHIGSDAFAQYTNLVKVVLHDSVESIGPFAFSECINIQYVEIPASVTNIGVFAFQGCTSLTGIVVRASAERIPEGMCARCYNLENIDLGEHAKIIGERAFYGCRSLKRVCIPESVQKIGQSAFSHCGKMERVILYNKMPYIDKFAFHSCYNLRCVVAHPDAMLADKDVFGKCGRLNGFVLAGIHKFNNPSSPFARDGYSSIGKIGEALGLRNISASEKDMNIREQLSRDIEKAISSLYADMKEDVYDMKFMEIEKDLRNAADGLCLIKSNSDAILRVDAFAAGINQMLLATDIETVKEYLRNHSIMTIDSGDKIIAYICPEQDIAISAEFSKGKVRKYILSEGLKKMATVGCAGTARPSY